MFVFLVGGKGFSTKGADIWNETMASLLGSHGWRVFPHEEFEDVTYGESVLL